MRIHFGVSKFIRPSTLIKVLGALFVGLLAYFGITEHAYASTLTNVPMTPDLAQVYRDNSADGVNVSITNGGSCGVSGGNSCYIVQASDFNGFPPLRFLLHYPALNYCSEQNYKAKVNFKFLVMSPMGTQTSGSLHSYFPTSLRPGTVSTITTGDGTVINSFDLTWDSSKSLYLTLQANVGSTYYLQVPQRVDITCEYTTAESTTDIINNQNQNTQDIINNQNQNTQDIIDNQIQNTQDIIDSNKVCINIDKSFVSTNGYLSSNGSIIDNSNYGITDYINIFNGDLSVINGIRSSSAYACYYNVNKVLISCFSISNLDVQTLSLPNNAYYFRSSIHLEQNKPSYSLCKNGSQAVSDSLTDDDISGANSEIVNVFGVSVQDHGLTSVAIAPIRLLSNLLDSNSSCSDLSFDISLGSMTKNVSLPSGCILWGSAPSSVIAIYQTFIFGLLGFYVLLDMYKFLSNLLDPENKEIYFLDL